MKSWNLNLASDLGVQKASYSPPLLQARPGELVCCIVKTRWDPDPQTPPPRLITRGAVGLGRGKIQPALRLSAPSPCGLCMTGPPPWRAWVDPWAPEPEVPSVGSLLHVDPAAGTQSPLDVVPAAAGAPPKPLSSPRPVRAHWHPSCLLPSSWHLRACLGLPNPLCLCSGRAGNAWKFASSWGQPRPRTAEASTTLSPTEML